MSPFTSALPPAAFLPPAPLFSAARAPTRAAARRPPCTRTAQPRAAAAPPPPSSRPALSVGAVVAVRDGRRVSVARVTGAAGDGRTVDLAPLKEFVRELYVVDEDAKGTYAKAADVREVRAEYNAGQDGWVVLDANVDAVRAEFNASEGGAADDVVVVEAERRVFSGDALKRDRGFGFPRPTRAQAVAGGLACGPLAAVFYSGWAGARGGLGGDVQGFGGAVLSAGAAGTAGCVVLGVALLGYAATYKEGDDA